MIHRIAWYRAADNTDRIPRKYPRSDLAPLIPIAPLVWWRPAFPRFHPSNRFQSACLVRHFFSYLWSNSANEATLVTLAGSAHESRHPGVPLSSASVFSLSLFLACRLPFAHSRLARHIKFFKGECFAVCSRPSQFKDFGIPLSDGGAAIAPVGRFVLPNMSTFMNCGSHQIPI
jgi:hypothetical protein